jgi:diaminopimelate decarboxylase
MSAFCVSRAAIGNPAAAKSESIGARRSVASVRGLSTRAVTRAVIRRANRAGVVAMASGGDDVETLRFLTPKDCVDVKEKFGTPTYVYDLARLTEQATKAKAFPNAYGLTVRYAMKASPNAAILKVFRKAGLHIDASSGYEVHRAVKAGFGYDQISLSTQEFPDFFAELVETNVGGPSSSFGIWHELLPQAKEIVERHELVVDRIHTHIGSGSDPAVWMKTSGMSLDLCREFPTVETLNLGGGYKVGRMSYEQSTDLQVVGSPVKGLFETFAEETGRELKLEIEPGTFLLANSCAVVSTVQDKVVTSDDADGHTFLKLDAGMTEVLRPSLYAAQHPLVTVKADGVLPATHEEYVVVGHCCESGDLMTPTPDDAEGIAERKMGAVEIGDLLVVEGAGAYCAGMSSKNYNSFPEAPEVMKGRDGTMHLIRQKQTLEQILVNELELPDDAC